ncbi:hypothetical protein [Hymenobacter coccineus]|uniref:hypothetical protein n=1 Tax=Hymenobacter coccineus TaxID=1908235 RepID=UPI000F786F9C|nr:hypothetical protein [Hymenobacter coccineus]
MSEIIAITNDALRELLNQLVGKPAWRSRAGNGTGSIFTLQFGPELPNNKTQGEFSLMVYCAWRVVKGNQILLSWHDDSDEILAPGLAMFHEAVVTAIKLSQWNDLIFHFSNGQEIQIINDFSPFNDFDESWSVIHNGRVAYAVRPDNDIDYKLLPIK